MIDDQLHFVFLSIINHLQWQVLVIIPVFVSFFVRGENGAVEYVMDGPGFG
jgi:hypothetical protein